MSDLRDQADDPIEAELRSRFRSRTTPAAPPTLRTFAEQVGSATRPTAPLRGLAVGWRQPPGSRLAVLGASIVVVVLAGGLLLVAGQRGPGAPTSSPGTSQAAVASSQPAGSPPTGSPPAATSSATPSPDVTARYPDGIPSTLLGQHVYRPSDLRQSVPTVPFLLGGWDAGPLAVSCPAMIRGASNPPCPAFEGLAETRGGPVSISVRWGGFQTQGAPALVLRVSAEPAPTCVSIPSGACPGPSVTVQDVLWSGDPATTSPSSLPSPPSRSLPSSGGTCSADQLILGSATSGFTFGALNYRHAVFTQVVRNAGSDCVLGVPKVIGVATASGPLVAVSVNNTGNEVCVNSACHYVTPPTYTIRSGQSFEIDFSVSWFVSATDGNGTPLSSAPPCVRGVTDVTRVAFPVASGAIAIDLEAASQQAGASVPWHQVCSSPTSISFEIKP